MLNFDELQILHEALRHQLQPSTKARKSSLTVKEKICLTLALVFRSNILQRNSVMHVFLKSSRQTVMRQIEITFKR